MAKKLTDKNIPLRTVMKAVGISRSTYYYQTDAKDDHRKKPLDEELKAKLERISGYELTYGYRKVTKKLSGYNHKKVYRHMKKLNMLQPRKLKKKKARRLPGECPIGSNVRWEGDLTYVFDGQRLNYLFVVVDTYDKEILGDQYGLRCRADEAVTCLENAVIERFGNLNHYEGIRVVLRIDQGSQYISKKFKKRAKELGVELEYCGINCPDDKPYVESFFSRFKCEEVYRREYTSFSDGFLGWNKYKQWYNNERIHQGLDWKTIPEFKIAGHIKNDRLTAFGEKSPSFSRPFFVQ